MALNKQKRQDNFSSPIRRKESLRTTTVDFIYFYLDKSIALGEHFERRFHDQKGLVVVFVENFDFNLIFHFAFCSNFAIHLSFQVQFESFAVESSRSFNQRFGLVQSNDIFACKKSIISPFRPLGVVQGQRYLSSSFRDDKYCGAFIANPPSTHLPLTMEQVAYFPSSQIAFLSLNLASMNPSEVPANEFSIT